MQTENQIELFQPSENVALSRTLMGLETQLEAAARQNLGHVLQEQGTELQSFTDLQIQAMVETEKLRLVNGIDLATLLLRGKILKRIEEGALATVHPNQYRDLTHLAQEQGISLSELSDTRTMTQIIFPFIENTLNIPIAQIWESVGKTKFRTMVPVLKALITGEEPDTGTARDNYNRILDTTAIEMREMDMDVTDERVRGQAISNMLTAAEQMPARELQEHIRDGNPTPALNPTILVVDGRRIMISEVSEEQMIVVRRKLGRHMSDPNTVTLSPDTRARQREAARVAILRDINRIFEG